MNLTTMAFIGAPNSGKTSLFNALTGSKQKIANYPGATVESALGQITSELKIIDLPGVYGLNPRSLDERISRDYIIKNPQSSYLQKFATDERDYHTLVVIADSTRLAQSLYLVRELQALKIPVFLVLNRADLATKRKQIIDEHKLAELLGIPVLQTSSFDKNSVATLKNKLIELAKLHKTQVTPIDKRELHQLIHSPDWSRNHYLEAEQILQKAIVKKIEADNLAEKVDQWLTHPFWGLLFLCSILLVLFQALFQFSGPLQDMIAGFFDSMANLVVTWNFPKTIESFLVNGVIAGVGGVLVFLPQIAILYLFIGILEESGYLSRVAFLLDRYMQFFGLPGKAIIPLLSSHACAIPGIMATRSLSNERSRLTTILIAPLMTCSARLPVYTLLLATFLPVQQQGLGLLIIYLSAIAMSFLISWIIKFMSPKNNIQSMLIELPSYQIPRWDIVFSNITKKCMLFIKKAGTVILLLTVILWVLSYFPRQDSKNYQIENSYAGMIGNMVQPIFAPLGFDQKMTTALIPSFAAREVMVASMATVMSIEDAESDAGLSQLQERIRSTYTLGTILALIVWFIFAPQCLSTFAVIKRETHGYKWAWITFGYTAILAYTFALLTKVIVG